MTRFLRSAWKHLARAFLVSCRALAGVDYITALTTMAALQRDERQSKSGWICCGLFASEATRGGRTGSSASP